MKRFQSILCTSLLTLAMSSVAMAGDISGRAGTARAGDISGRAGDISGRTGDISGRAGDISGRAGDISGLLDQVYDASLELFTSLLG
jgi:hypothetical protein